MCLRPPAFFFKLKLCPFIVLMKVNQIANLKYISPHHTMKAEQLQILREVLHRYLFKPVGRCLESWSSFVFPHGWCWVRMREVQTKIESKGLGERCSGAPYPPGGAVCLVPVLLHHFHRGRVARQVSHRSALLPQQKIHIPGPGFHTITELQRERAFQYFKVTVDSTIQTISMMRDKHVLSMWLWVKNNHVFSMRVDGAFI